MYAVLIVPPATDVGRCSLAMAELLGGTAYDHRQPLQRGLPFLVGWRQDAGEARAIAQRVASTGVPAWPISRAALDLAPEREEVRAFAVLRGGIELAGRQRTFRLDAADIGLILPCRADAGQTTTTTTTTRKAGMAQMAMGVPIATKRVETEQHREFEQRFFCLLWARRSEGPDLLFDLQADHLDFGGLGSLRTPSSTTNYLRLLEVLRALAPQAWDARLERAGGKIAPVVVPQRTGMERQGRNTTVATAVSGWDTQGAVTQTANLLILAARLCAASNR